MRALPIALIALIALSALSAALPLTAQAPDGPIDWSTQVAALRADTGTMRVTTAGSYGCEITFDTADDGPDFVVYSTADGMGAVTLIVPPAWLEDGAEQLSTLILAQEGKMVIRQAMFNQVTDPERGAVLRTQEMDDLPEALAATGALIVGSVNEDREPLTFEFAAGQTAQAGEMFTDCLRWIKANPPAE